VPQTMQPAASQLRERPMSHLIGKEKGAKCHPVGHFTPETRDDVSKADSTVVCKQIPKKNFVKAGAFRQTGRFSNAHYWPAGVLAANRRNSKRWIRFVRPRHRQNRIMKLIIIEKFPVPIGNFEDVTAQTAADGVGDQHKTASDTILFGQEFYSHAHALILPQFLSIFYSNSVIGKHSRRDSRLQRLWRVKPNSPV
jgi:hypothetical protein